MRFQLVAGTLLVAVSVLVSACGSTTGVPASNGSPVTAGKPTASASGVPAAPATTSGRKEVALVSGPRARLVETLNDLQKGDVAAARSAFDAYDSEWNGIEVYVNFRSRQLYGDIETHYQADIAKALEDAKPDPANIIPDLRAMIDKYDEAIKLSDTGPAISPLFDDVAAVRIVRAPLRTVSPALKANNTAKAKQGFTAFTSKWDDVEDLIKARSTDAYHDVESAMAAADRSMSAATVNAAEAGPLVDALMDRYNFGVNLINAAARGADVGKKSFTDQEVRPSAALGAVQDALKASMTQWQGGQYVAAGEAARTASQRFSAAAPVLQARGGADAAPKKALESYAGLAGQAGDAKAVSSANRAAIEATAIAQQTIAGQFWTDSGFQTAYQQALKAGSTGG